MTQPTATGASLTDSIRTLTAAVNQRAAADALHEEASDAILDAVRRMTASAPTPRDPDLLAVLRHLYWQQPSLSSSRLAIAAGYPSAGELTRVIGSVPSGIACDGCQRDMPRTSRSWMPPQRWANGLQLCKHCEKERSDARQRQWAVDRKRREFVDAAPVAAWAADWLVATTLVLAYPPVGTGMSPETADYVGLWRAYDLAQERHTEFVRMAADQEATVPVSLARALVSAAEEVTGWDVERNLTLIEPITDETPTVVLTRIRRRIDIAAQQRAAEAVQSIPPARLPEQP